MPPNEPHLAITGPTGETLRALRTRSNRTQAQMATLLKIDERTYQRYELDTEMPVKLWNLLLRVWGSRHPVDFEQTRPMTRDWNRDRDIERDTIERGDVVELQPVVGPLLRATVCLDRVHDGLVDEQSYGAFVTEFVGAVDGGQEYRGFFIGERVTFARANVIHLDQRVPATAARQASAEAAR
ncbi:XRE family transcriptional regulator (plasmid) [Burkholderia gladioli]|nr:XRE family transcriptional regulator [Burkholderia gladioli]